MRTTKAGSLRHYTKVTEECDVKRPSARAGKSGVYEVKERDEKSGVIVFKDPRLGFKEQNMGPVWAEKATGGGKMTKGQMVAQGWAQDNDCGQGGLPKTRQRNTEVGGGKR